MHLNVDTQTKQSQVIFACRHLFRAKLLIASVASQWGSYLSAGRHAYPKIWEALAPT